VEAIDIQSRGRVNSNSHAIDSEDRREGKGRAKKTLRKLEQQEKRIQTPPSGIHTTSVAATGVPSDYCCGNARPVMAAARLND